MGGDFRPDVARDHQPHIIITSILFSSVELAATLLHWDRMSAGGTPSNGFAGSRCRRVTGTIRFNNDVEHDTQESTA